jgi:hypothetical protein
LRLSVTRFRATVLSVSAAALLVTAVPGTVAAAEPEAKSTSGSAAKVIREAKEHLGKRFKLGTEGPRTFDCSGLVYRAFKDAGLVHKVTGRRNTARGLLNHFRSRGLASRTGGRAGDLVVWGNGKHIGIYIGNGKALSALTSGVKVHGLYNLKSRFTTFLHVGLAGGSSESSDPPPSSSSSSPDREVAKRTALRTGAGTSYRAVKTLLSGLDLDVLASRTTSGNRWYKVRTPKGSVGWVLASATRAL